MFPYPGAIQLFLSDCDLEVFPRAYFRITFLSLGLGLFLSRKHPNRVYPPLSQNFPPSLMRVLLRIQLMVRNLCGPKVCRERKIIAPKTGQWEVFGYRKLVYSEIGIVFAYTAQICPKKSPSGQKPRRQPIFLRAWSVHFSSKVCISPAKADEMRWQSVNCSSKMCILG